ncbi:hypothetical protein AGR1A_Cc20599 [Agrobacterium fabacearum CFBP 5771]|nr:hypothetical protein AGR1A_Cc20599 [Agrobacterium fabacearum CFBP 5771]
MGSAMAGLKTRLNRAGTTRKPTALKANRRRRRATVPARLSASSSIRASHLPAAWSTNATAFFLILRNTKPESLDGSNGSDNRSPRLKEWIKRTAPNSREMRRSPITEHFNQALPIMVNDG